MKNFSKNIRLKIYSITGGRCFYCGCKLDFDDFQVDHFIPKASNGVHRSNRVPVCKDCNLIKSDKTIEEFRETIEKYVCDDIHVRMIDKYMGIKKKRVKFYFESGNFSPY